MNHQHADAPRRDDLLAAVMQKFPYFKRYLPDYAVVQGRPMIVGDDRQLESYAPDENWNPAPGHATTELYNDSVPQDQQVNLTAGDLLHHLAKVDPRWAALKASVVSKLGHSLTADHAAYGSRGDEFLMGYLTPDAADDWRDSYTPEQQVKLQQMKELLMKYSGDQQ